MIKFCFATMLIVLGLSCSNKIYDYHSFNKQNSTYYILPGHTGLGSYKDSSIVFLSFYELFAGGCVKRTEGLKITIDNKRVIYLDTTGDYPILLNAGPHSFFVESSGMMYPVKTKKFNFPVGGNYNLVFYLVNAGEDPALRNRPRDPNYKHKAYKRR